MFKFTIFVVVIDPAVDSVAVAGLVRIGHHFVEIAVDPTVDSVAVAGPALHHRFVRIGHHFVEIVVAKKNHLVE